MFYNSSPLRFIALLAVRLSIKNFDYFQKTLLSLIFIPINSDLKKIFISQKNFYEMPQLKFYSKFINYSFYTKFVPYYDIF